jgi:NADPH2:quinone reductase
MAHSRAIAGFWLMHAIQQPGGLQPAMDELFSLVRAGRLRPVVGRTYPLDSARDAHDALRSRSTTGKVVLTVPG